MGAQPSSNFVLDAIFKLAVSLIATLVVYGLRQFIDWVKSRRKTAALRYVFLVVLVIMNAIPVYYLSSWFLGITSDNFQDQLIFCAGLLQIVAGYGLYRLMRQYMDDEQYNDKPQKVEVLEKRDSPLTIPVRRLHSVSSDPNDRLYLNWKTFWKGAKFLIEQIDYYAPKIEPDLCIGINNPGLIIASIISEKLRHGDRYVGLVRTVGADHLVTEIVTPELKEQKYRPYIILVADIEVKRGKAIKNVLDAIRDKYGNNSQIYIAVLVASQVRKEIQQTTELITQGVFREEQRYLPNFLAFTCFNKIGL